MKPKTIKIIYWVLVTLFSLAMLGDAIGGITMQQAGVVVLKHLGYPLYMMPMYGVAKILGIIAILQPKYRAIKEWAFAGFVFTFISAFLSRVIMHDPVADLAPPLIILAFTLAVYLLWKKLQTVQSA